MFNKESGIPLVKGSPIVGVLPEFKNNPLAFMDRVHSQYGDLAELRLPLPGIRAFSTIDPELIKLVLLEDEKRFTKHPWLLSIFLKTVGPGLFSIGGPKWRSSRERQTPAYSTEANERYFPIIVEETEKLVTRLENNEGKHPIDISKVLSLLTMAITVRAFFNIAWKEKYEPLIEVFDVIQEYTKHVTEAAFPLPHIFPTAQNRRFKEATRTLDNIIDDMISQWDASPDKPLTLIKQIKDVYDDYTGGRLNKEHIRGEIINTLFAGHDTTSTTVSYALQFLSGSPQAQTALDTELANELKGTPPAYIDIPRLEYTQAVISETMRIHPPTYVLQRMCKEDIAYKGKVLPKSSIILISVWGTHRAPELWEAPLSFNPERFTKDNRRGRHRFSYLPFGGGPRTCIGKNLAVIEATYILAVLVQRFQIRCTSSDTRPMAHITLRPTQGIQARFHARTSKEFA